MRAFTAALIAALLGLAVAGQVAAQAQAQEPAPLVPESVSLAEPVRTAIDAEWLTTEERADLRVFHGVWDQSDLDTPARQATVALNAWDFDDPALSNPQVAAEVRAEAMLRRGEVRSAIELLEDARSIRASRIRAEAYEALGDFDAADDAIDEPVRLLLTRKLEDAAALTEGVRALIIRSRLRGQPARDFQTMMDLLSRARSAYDRLYWPATLTEAQLLLDKDNTAEAETALHEVLSMNPRCARAWYMLGRIALSRFDFESARRAADHLERLNADHPLAILIRVESRLTQNDPDLGLQMLDDLLGRHPKMRPARALRCAAIALTYDEAALQRALAEYDELSPGSAKALYEAGRYLSFDRQYEAAAELLQQAIERQPKWPAPRIELGLLEMQSGRDALALSALRSVSELDPFNKRVANSLFLLEELMANFAQEETEHFIIRYSPETDDRVMVAMMGEKLEEIHEIVARRFEHEPDRKTIIELMPNHEWFAVRIGGMPFIHTIAACTGPVIAMEVPREGPQQLHFGLYDWPRVLQHEYTHTITLSQTRNRIPHWLTEAAAVSMEPGPRDFRTVKMLVSAYNADRLFDLDEINWAFVRPKQPGDRALAYAQGHWMVEFMNERFGESALIRLLGRYFEGEREAEAIPAALGVSREEFFESFLAWAGEEIKTWGFGVEPSLETLKDRLRERDPEAMETMNRNRRMLLDALTRVMTRRVGEPGPAESESLEASDWPDLPKPEVEITDDQLALWLEEYPDHPDLLKLAIDRALAMAEEPGFEHVPLLERYAELRPVDPSPHRTLALIWRNSDAPQLAIPHLEALDVREEYDNVYAVALAELYRDAGAMEKALEKATRAVNIDPYDAPLRELAATIAVEAGRLDEARTHIVALTVLEPDRAVHQRRLEAIDRMIAERAASP